MPSLPRLQLGRRRNLQHDRRHDCPQFEYLGYNGSGNFTQSGGTNNAYTLYLGYNSGASGTYSLSGTGALSASSEYIGYNSTATASLQQTGSSNSVSTLSIGSGDQYLLSGGELTITNNITNSGTVNGAGGSVTVAANCLLDLTSGTWKNYSNWTVSTGTNGLLIVPAGFNVATGLAGVTTAGLGVHVAGTPLNVPAGQGFSGTGTISDQVVCQGTIAASNTTAISLTNGLILSGSGSVNLIGGSLTVNDAASGISGGTLTAAAQYVGSGGTGTFAQSAGSNTSSSLYLGYNSTDTGTFCLKRHGQADHSEADGVPRLFRHGQFHPVGRGRNGCYDNLYLGYNSAAAGTYTLSGGSLWSGVQYVGVSPARAPLPSPAEQTPCPTLILGQMQSGQRDL